MTRGTGMAILYKGLQLVFVLFGISFFTFLLIMLSPGDVAKAMIAGNEDIIVSQAEIEAVRQQYGLDQPLYMQYGHWVWNLLHGDMGHSFMTKMSVVQALSHHLPATLMLTVAAVVIMLLISVPLGVYAAVHRNSWIDTLIRSGTFVGISIPGFWLGLILLYVFGLKLRLLPIVGGVVGLKTVILPALTLAIAMSAKYTRQVRAAIMDELNQDYVTGARARGMSESYILWREVLPNALLPLLTLLGLMIGNLLGGAAVVEIVFGWPGLGRLAVEAITYRDFLLVQGDVLWIACMYMVINLLVDISYSIFDPRLRKVGRG